jgi:acyl CoA:acetate/3-ketoacid CoA transferase beta subunit
MFDIAQEEVMSSGDVSIMGDNHHPGGSNEEKNARISRFITKNKSLHFIISDTGVQNPTNPKILRVSDLH